MIPQWARVTWGFPTSQGFHISLLKCCISLWSKVIKTVQVRTRKMARRVKSTCCQAWCTEFNPRNSCGGREPVLTSCLPTSTWTTELHALRINKCKKKKIIERLSQLELITAELESSTILASRFNGPQTGSTWIWLDPLQGASAKYNYVMFSDPQMKRDHKHRTFQNLIRRLPLHGKCCRPYLNCPIHSSWLWGHR